MHLIQSSFWLEPCTKCGDAGAGESEAPQGVVNTSDGRVVRAFHRFTLVDQTGQGRDLTKGRRRDQVNEQVLPRPPSLPTPAYLPMHACQPACCMRPCLHATMFAKVVCVQHPLHADSAACSIVCKGFACALCGVRFSPLSCCPGCTTQHYRVLCLECTQLHYLYLHCIFTLLAARGAATACQFDVLSHCFILAL